jgi:hypothetical protein
MVRTLTVTFSEVVTLGDDAFLVTRDDGGTFTPVVATAEIAGQTVATLSFAGDGIVGGSLPDGSYRLSIDAAQVTDPGGAALDGDAVRDFYRLFGDADGDRDVDGRDYVQLFQAFRTSSYVEVLDHDGDGDLDLDDVAEFRRRYGRRMAP